MELKINLRKSTRFLLHSLVIIISCFGYSCEENQEREKECVIDNLSNGPFTAHYNRDSNGRVITIDYSYIYDTVSYQSSTLVEYDANSLIIRLSNERVYVDYTYNSFKQLITEEIYHLDSSEEFPLESGRTFEYNEKGLLSKTKYNNDHYHRYEYDDRNNLSRVYTKGLGAANEFLSKEYVSFDDSKNPFYDLGLISHIGY